MKNFYYYSILLIASLLIGCSGNAPDVQQVSLTPSDTQDLPNPLVGTWELVSYKYGKETEFTDMTDLMKEIKLITPTHFSWTSYDEQEVIGSGGGTYTYQNGRYIEKIDFFYPQGTGMIGSEQVFECRVEGKKWIHKGYIKRIEFDPIALKYVVADSSALEEVWEKID